MFKLLTLLFKLRVHVVTGTQFDFVHYCRLTIRENVIKTIEKVNTISARMHAKPQTMSLPLFQLGSARKCTNGNDVRLQQLANCQQARSQQILFSFKFTTFFLCHYLDFSLESSCLCFKYQSFKYVFVLCIFLCCKIACTNIRLVKVPSDIFMRIISIVLVNPSSFDKLRRSNWFTDGTLLHYNQ